MHAALTSEVRRWYSMRCGSSGAGGNRPVGRAYRRAAIFGAFRLAGTLAFPPGANCAQREQAVLQEPLPGDSEQPIQSTGVQMHPPRS